MFITRLLIAVADTHERQYKRTRLRWQQIRDTLGTMKHGAGTLSSSMQCNQIVWGESDRCGLLVSISDNLCEYWNSFKIAWKHEIDRLWVQLCGDTACIPSSLSVRSLSLKLAHMEVSKGRPWVIILQSLERFGVHLGLDNTHESWWE